MANEIVTASIVINFADRDTGILTAEVDDRPSSEGGYNGGETTFYPGDSPVFLRYASSNVTVTVMDTSDGTLTSLGTVVVQKTEILQFANKREATLSYPLYSGFTVVRSSPGAPAVSVDANTNIVSLASVDTAVVQVTYLSRADAIRVSGATGDLPVVVYIEGRVA